MHKIIKNETICVCNWSVAIYVFSSLLKGERGTRE